MTPPPRPGHASPAAAIRAAALVAAAALLAIAAPAHAWLRPVPGAVARGFAYSPAAPFAAGRHRGADFAARPGEPVRAACTGRVALRGPRRRHAALRSLAGDAPAAGDVRRPRRSAACAKARAWGRWRRAASMPACTSASAAPATASRTSTRCRSSGRKCRAWGRPQSRDAGRPQPRAADRRRRGVAAPAPPHASPRRPTRGVRVRAVAAWPRVGSASRSCSAAPSAAGCACARARGGCSLRRHRRRDVTGSAGAQAASAARRGARPPLAFDAAMAFYVTTPIFYVNAAPHLGHAYTTIGADILARHMRQRGEEVFFLTGTDEHGEPVAQAAEREGVTPKELADRNAERFKALMPRINATNDFFIRTSDPRHKRAVQDVMQRIHDNGYAYKGMYEGWYCPRCADFKTENEVGPGQHLPDPQDPARPRAARRTGSSSSPPSRSALEQLYADQPELRAPAPPLQRGAARSSPAASTTSASAARSSPGASRSRGTRTTSSTSGSTRC